MTDAASGAEHPGFLPARFSPRVFRMFSFVVRRKIRGGFHAVWMTPGTREVLEGLEDVDGPLIIAMNHVSWWDPLVGILVHGRFLPRHQLTAPMDSTQLVKFGFFRKLGIFGIDPDDPGTLTRMNDWITGLFHQHRRVAFWIMPQGRFTDVRDPIRTRPGIATNAVSNPEARVLTFHMEYTFWKDSRPELCLHARHVEPPERATTPRWHRRIKESMQAGTDALAELVRTRDEDRFDPLVPPAANRTNPVYDLWLKVRGRRGDLEVAHRTEQRT